MNKRFFLRLLLLAVGSVFAMDCLAQETVYQSGVTYTGRTLKDSKGQVSYDWVGTYLQTDFTGGKIAVDIADSDTSYHNVFIDNVWIKKIKVFGKVPHTVILASGLSKKVHRLRLQKCTEGQYGCTTISGFRLAKGGKMKEVAPKKRFIEVYGDSYTCGYGTEGLRYDEHFKLSTENCNKAYACMIARYFDADYSLVAHSGQGIIRNWGSPTQQSDTNMYVRHNLVMDAHGTEVYDFSAYRPSLVMINLGTNDFSPVAIPTAKQYAGQYEKLIASLRKHYGEIPILCITPHSATPYLQAALQLFAKKMNGDKKVFMANSLENIITEATDLGSDWHPNEIGQRKIAMMLIPQISHIMGWEMSKKVVE